jgi:hypothetical protein
VQFVNDLHLPTCDRNLYTSTVSIRAADDAPASRSEDLLFDADVEHRGLSAYAHVIHGERIAVVDDPVLGSRRKVMQFTVEDGDIGPTADPRAQVETPKAFHDGDELWIGLVHAVPLQLAGPVAGRRTVVADPERAVRPSVRGCGPGEAGHAQRR